MYKHSNVIFHKQLNQQHPKLAVVLNYQIASQLNSSY